MMSSSSALMGLLTLLFAVAAFFVYRRALPQSLRPLQVVMPVVALAYCAVLFFLQGFFYVSLDSHLRALSGNGDFLQDVASAAASSAGVFSAWALAFLAVIVFGLLKQLIFFIFKRVEKELPNTLLNYFRGLYSFAFAWNAAGGMWSIKDEYRALGKLSKWLYLVVLVACSVLLYLFPSTVGLYSPCYGIIIFGEIACFLQAPPCTEEKEAGVLDYEGDSTRIANYDRLTEAYRAYRDRIISLDKETGRPHREVVNHAIVTPLLESESLEDNLAGQYLKSLQRMGYDLDDDKAGMLKRLLHGENIVCASPFYWDFGRYILFPMVRALSHGEKAMVLCGSDIRIEDAKAWLEKEIGFVSGVEELWRIGSLFECEDDEEIDICCMNVNDANRQEELSKYREYLTATRFVLLLNPSTSFSSAQVGLGLLARSLGGGRKVTYCICDKNTNGLVDSLSHALRANFVEVESPRVPEGTVCSVVWKAEDPRGISLHHQLFGEVAQYLGLGTEIASIAAKYGISHIVWTGQSNVPLCDMRWIAQQYYRKICAFADLDASASTIDNYIVYKNGMWDSQVEEHAFYIVEDEGANAFEVLRRFASRGRQDSFVNVISPNYLLRDYMSENSRLFLADPKAVPHIIPDYANTLRNNALSLFARLSCGPVPESEIKKSLLLAGIGGEDVVSLLVMLATMYLDVDCASEKLRGSIVPEEMITGIDPETLCYKKERFIKLSRGHDLERACGRILAQSFYICEDEELNKNVLGSCLTGHMYQNALPSQGIILEGKYYEVLSIDSGDASNRVLLRRAADHFDRRLQYRQIRNVFIDDWRQSNRLNRTREYASLRFELAEANIVVSTEGYLEMGDLADFERARFVRLATIPERTYRNKAALRVSFEEDAEVTPEIIATLTVLLSELFRTVYNENAKYLLVGSLYAQESDFPKGSYTALESIALDEKSIYILEDSDIDLGLIDSVDRNIIKFLEIIEDYLTWHCERVNREDFEEDDRGIDEGEFELNIPDEILEMPAVELPLSFWDRVKRFLFGHRKKKDAEDAADVVGEEGAAETADKAGGEGGIEGEEGAAAATREADSSTETDSSVDAGADADAQWDDGMKESYEVGDKGNGESDTSRGDGSDEASDSRDERGVPQALASVHLARKSVLSQQVASPFSTDEKDVDTIDTFGKLDYKHSNFLMFGRGAYPQSLAVSETVEFLDGLGVYDADLRRARKDARENREAIVLAPDDGSHCCDFCGEPILSLEYDILEDGRERCSRCTREAISSLEEFERVYADVRKTMCALYHITLPTSIKMKMTTAAEIAKRTGSEFVATNGFDARTVGVAIKSGRGNYTLLVEGGSPRIAAVGTLAHELTHIWQYENWKGNDIAARYGVKSSLSVHEGMAVWSEVQYLLATNNRTIAVKRLMNEIQRSDVYGEGLRKYYKKYGLTTKPCSTLTKDHPFQHGTHPLD